MSAGKQRRPDLVALACALVVLVAAAGCTARGAIDDCTGVEQSRVAKLLRLAPASGALLGDQPVPYGDVPAVLVGNSMVVYGTDEKRQRGELLSVDTATGALRWSVGASPRTYGLAADDDAVYLRQDEQVEARDARTGAVRWKQDTPPASEELRAVPAGVVATERGDLVLRRRDDGTPIVRLPEQAARVRWTRAPVGSRLPPEDRPLIAALAAATRTSTPDLWASGARGKPTLVSVSGAIAVHVRPATTVLAADGTVRWRTRRVVGRPLPVSSTDLLFHSDGTGRLSSVRLADGAIRWTWDAPPPSGLTSVATRHGRTAVSFRRNDGPQHGAVLLDDRSGRVLARYLQDEPGQPPILAAWPTTDGLLIADESPALLLVRGRQTVWRQALELPVADDLADSGTVLGARILRPAVYCA